MPCVMNMWPLYTYHLCSVVTAKDLVHGIIVFFLFPGHFAAGLHRALDNILDAYSVITVVCETFASCKSGVTLLL